MSHPFPIILDVLYAAGEMCFEERLSALSVISIDRNSSIGSILVADQQKLDFRRFGRLLETTDGFFTSYKVQRSCSDWPFEHFWTNPDEPKHSMFLGYFINPKEDHGCGIKLLELLLETIAPQLNLSVDDQCEVECEMGRLDISIIRKSKDGKDFALIIENKINGAKHREKQVSRYVKLVRTRDDIPCDRIYAFYLPLTGADNPDPQERAKIDADKQDVQQCQSHWFDISFEEHILPWLRKALSSKPGSFEEGMISNLRHYRDLVKFLINKQRKHNMNAQILKALEKAKENGELPVLSEVESLITSATDLKACLKSSLRGKLLMEVKSLLDKQNLNPFFCSSEFLGEMSFDSEFDPRFEHEVNLCVPVDAKALVCFGCCDDGKNMFSWFGYSKKGDQMIPAEIIADLVEKHQLNAKNGDESWYVWERDNKINYDNCIDEATVKMVVEKLIEMKDELSDRLKIF